MYKCYSSSRCAHNALQSFTRLIGMTFKPYQWCMWYKKNQNYLQMNICKVKWRRVIWINRANILIMNITTFFVNKSESMAFKELPNLCGNIFEQFSSLTSCENTRNFIRLWYSSPNVFSLHNEQNAKTSFSLTLSLTLNWYFMTRDSKCRNMTLKRSESV